MDLRLRALHSDSNLSNMSLGGYETAQDESGISIYYSMTEDSLMEDDADLTTVATDETISGSCATPLQITADDMIDAAGQLHAIPAIVVTCITNDVPENEQFCETNEECAMSSEEHAEVAHPHLQIGCVKEPTINPIPQTTTQISNEFNKLVPTDPSNNSKLCTIITDEPTKSAIDFLKIENQQSSLIDLAAGHLSTIEEIDEICDLQRTFHSKPLEVMTIGRSTRMSLSTQHRQGTIKNAARLLSTVAADVPAQNKPVKTRQSLAPKIRSPFKRNGLRHSMHLVTESSKAAGSSKMALRRSSRLSIAHGKMATHKINPKKSPSKIMVASPSRPIVKSPLKPTAVAAEAKAAAATRFPRSSYVCGVCSKSFLLMSSLTKHKKTHKTGTSSSKTCKHCDKSFAIASALDTHLREKCTKIPIAQRRKLINYGPSRPVASMPDNSSSSSATSHSGSARKMPHSGIYRTPSKILRCHTCGEQFKEFNSFTDHSATHDEV